MSFATPAIEHDVKSLAVELRGKFIEAVRNNPNRRFEVVENAGDDGLTLEIALIEVVPNKGWLGAIGLAAWGSPFLSAGVAASTVAEMFDRGWVSMEARIREGGSGRIAAQFADSEMGRTRIIDLRSSRGMATQFVERVNTPMEDAVPESPWFSFRPW